jgi:predicted ATPase/GGDEF domain-containing protein
LEQYHTCRGLLFKELGVEPAAETQALYELIRDGQLIAEKHAPSAVPVLNNLPAGLTSFFGRETELAQIEECLEKPACRLIALVGMPGSGKSRLALRAARNRLAAFPDGVWYTALGSNPGQGGLAAKLLTSQGVTVQLEQPLEVQLLNRLRGMRCLLVLDNFETYLEETGLLIELLKQAPGVKVLLTSQVRLNYQSACEFHIRGMPCTEGSSMDLALESPTVQLFLARAQHTRSGFVLSEQNVAHVAAICKAVEGLPLAVELAAAALRDYRCEEISARLEHNLEVLNTSMLDLPAEHRSMQAALERPWHRLSPAQQTQISRMAGFRGEFGAAETGASQAELDELVDRSLLMVTSPGRYRLHRLVRLFLLAKDSQGDRKSEPSVLDMPGRSMYWDRLEHMLARAERYGQTAAVLMVTLEEGFPKGSIADSHISQLDRVVLQRIRRCLRKSDTALLLDRSVFGLILEDISRPEDSLIVAQKICEALGEVVRIEGVEYLPLVHMGISVYPRDAQQAGRLIECAEAAMREAAEVGNCCQMYVLKPG